MLKIIVVNEFAGFVCLLLLLFFTIQRERQLEISNVVVEHIQKEIFQNCSLLIDDVLESKLFGIKHKQGMTKSNIVHSKVILNNTDMFDEYFFILRWESSFEVKSNDLFVEKHGLKSF
jgi:hypothetical protein